MARQQDKGWACRFQDCGCLHNFATRTTCRWCGQKAPSIFVKKQKGSRQQRLNQQWSWAPWWPGWGESGGKDEETAGQGGAVEVERLSGRVNPTQKLQVRLQHYNEMAKEGEPTANEKAARQGILDQIKEEQRKFDESKPASAQMQRLENKVTTANNKLETVNKKLEK